MGRGRCRNRDRRALTLVELLVALALAAVLAVAAGRVAVSAMQVQRVLDAGVQESARERRVLDSLAADWSRRMTASSGAEAALRLTAVPEPMLEFAGLVPIESGALHVALRPAEVRYHRTSEGGASELVREVVDLTAPGHPVHRETLVRGVAEFGVELWIEGRWQKEFAQTSKRAELPDLLRVTLRFEGRSNAVRQTFDGDG